MNKDQEWIKAIARGETKALDRIYLAYKQEFIAFAKRYEVSSDDVLDIYQDCIIVLYENILKGKLITMSSSLKTYVFAIGKYKILAQLNGEAKNQKVGITENDVLASMELLEPETSEERIRQISAAIEHLGLSCQKILQLYYYQGLNLDEIQSKLGYESKDTVKSQKSRCLKQLKRLISE